ncbi:MAG: aminoacyl-tRNA deacylase [Ignavibacteria bacterium RBG_13_36_8]|nr:MAG: aminoacyl-tRNA deacylase [Ignavibacteria bacterium RBG_13_36_8]
MSKKDLPMTTAVRMLRDANVNFTPHFYKYEDKGGTKVAAESLQVTERETIKTLVMESDDGSGKKAPLIVIMHGDKEVSTKQLARFIGVKTVSPASEQAVTKYTGYIPGGVSPFGTKQKLPVYVESTIFNLSCIYINGGKRGFLVEIDPKILKNILPVTEVNVGIAEP